MSVLIVIQARLGSTRLPGKVLLPLGGKPVLQHVVERCQRTGYPVVVALPDSDVMEIGLAMARGMGMKIAEGYGYSGNPQDVLARYADTVRRYTEPAHAGIHPSIVVRITADCPLVDPRLIEAAVQAIRDGAEYAGNTVERHWPRGLDVEAFTTDLLLRAHKEASDPYDREHVTPWMQRHSIQYALAASIRPVEARTEWRWCLDTPRDYRWLQGLFTQYGDPSLEQAAAYSRIHPPPLD